MNASRKELYGCGDTLDLRDIIKVPNENRGGRHKCRVIYSMRVHEILFEPYHARSIRSLRIVRSNDMEYSHKYLDRERINKLFSLRDGCDDIIIIKNDHVTDTSSGNIVFFNDGRWVTPRNPLLKGTKRGQLLAEGMIDETDIRVTDIACFKKACLINAMLDLGETVIEIENIAF